ncbi:branched-chain amino acid ABC transporter permease [Noviherbaspirillum saxi]|uniref:Branched-chain amino acid ABC transporter permease n=1 Tax=Noviherbaspirillum saxi TaxID=2320863 RepID=A0A3A3FPV8_9BURK|nr:branched-chain amino acid ABC transporter permease [Noviherbaspirillum saxi]RJF98232.1 branched-chain amino acid ABC transporter permease [Noviherbaspirillum saxi]
MSKPETSISLAAPDIKVPRIERKTGVPYTKIAAALLVVSALLMPVVLPWLKTPVIFAACFGIAALGVSILIRAGQVSFGHAMFACAAGYAVAFAARWWSQLDSVVLLVIGTAFGAFFGLVVGLFVVRYRAIFFGMLNLALSMVLFAVLGKFFHLTGGTDGLRLARSSFLGMQLERDDFETALLISAVVLAVTVGVLVQRYLSSVAGQALTAIKTNETRLEYVGLSTYRILLVGYVLSAALCGLSGAMFVIAQGLVTPEMGYWIRSGEFIFIAILGGIAHPVGAFLGAAIFEFVKLFAAAYLTGAWQMVLGIVLIAMVFFAPMGISGLMVRLQAKQSKGENR